uniref:Gastrula zinc finger protein XlCGF46.1-like n=1 Tax=Sinocyclocheilus rhinocerous TaxID=307959 RepID=A0A673HMU9_9TELE
MALMQASSIAAPKKMMSPLGPASGHGSAQRDAQDRGMQGHMVLPMSMTCPPLVRRHLQAIDQFRVDVTVTSLAAVVVDENGNCPLSKVQKNFICDHCYGAFRSGYHLKRHILIHTGEKPFACAVCDMRFIQRYHLERHSLTHTGTTCSCLSLFYCIYLCCWVKPYACSMCDMRFFQRYHLERHSLTHTGMFYCYFVLRLGVKPYACTMCDMRFFQRYHLQRHSLIHTGTSHLLPSALLQLSALLLFI